MEDDNENCSSPHSRDMPWHSPPHMPFADLDAHLGDIIASFPPPVDWELSFDDLSAIMRGGSPEDSVRKTILWQS